MGMETDDKDEGGGHPPEGQHSQVDAKELEILEGSGGLQPEAHTPT